MLVMLQYRLRSRIEIILGFQFKYGLRLDNPRHAENVTPQPHTPLDRPLPPSPKNRPFQKSRSSNSRRI